VAVGDFTGDGLPDLAFGGGGSSGGWIDLLPGKGDGTFDPAIRTGLVTGVPAVLVPGEFNGDGHQDLAAFDGYWFVLIAGDGDGTFSSPTVFPLPWVGGGGLNQSAAIAEDIDLDGRLDFLIAGDWCQCATALLGKGDGTFVNGFVYAAHPGARGVAAADFNSDDKIDMAVADDRGITFLMNNTP
jgi:hypothetical protein